MGITNLFRSGNSEPSGFQFPSEKIVLSGEDLTLEGYQSLEVELFLTQTEAPILWAIYSDQVNEVFSIKAVPAGSNDKKYWVFIE